MKFLHTSDWHVGKSLRGRSRADEHRAVLSEVVEVARQRAVDFSLVAGDIFETAAPSAESEKIVYETLLALSEVAPVVVISGNHDSPRRLRAVAPLLKLGRVTVATEAKSPSQGGVFSLTTESGEVAQIALVPFVSQRSIVKADSLMDQAGFQHAQSYSDRMSKILQVMCKPFHADSVNIVLAHAFVMGGVVGGGERPAHLIDEYGVSSVSFPASASYVALGHLHRPQKVLGATAIHYCGSPLQLDFGEEQQVKQVNLVEASPALPATVEAVPLQSGRVLQTIQGSLAQLEGLELAENAWFRVRVVEPYRLGLAEAVRELLGEQVVDVRLESAQQQVAKAPRSLDSRSPKDLFKEYLTERSCFDEELLHSFVSLHEEVSG